MLNKDIQNIITNYNINKKIKLLNEILDITQNIYRALNYNNYKDNDWRIFKHYNEICRLYYYDLIPVLIDDY